MEKRLGKVFIDANMINYAVIYQKEDIFGWINSLYETIYIHATVLDELLTNRDRAQDFIDKNEWHLFDPSDPNCLPEAHNTIYEMNVEIVKNGFKRLEQKKEREGRTVKTTSNIGEINSLAAALYLSANLISSNDYDIREVIHDEHLTISLMEEEPEQFIIQDTVEDFCLLCVQNGIASKKQVKSFFKVVHTEDRRKNPQKFQHKVESLNRKLDEL